MRSRIQFSFFIALIAACVALAWYSISIVTGLPLTTRPLAALLGTVTVLLAAAAGWRAWNLKSALARERERIAIVFQVAQSGIVDLDIDANDHFLSARAKEILGFSAEDDPRHWRLLTDFAHPQDRALVRERLVGLIKDNQRFDVDVRVAHPERGLVWVNLVGACTRDAGGRARRFIGALLDITERKHQEEQVELLLRATQSGIIDWNVETGTIFYSAHFRQMLGYDAAADLSAWKDYIDFVHPDDRERARVAFSTDVAKAVSATGETRYPSIEYRVARADGGWLWVRGTGLGMLDEEGGVLRQIFSITDISEHRS